MNYLRHAYAWVLVRTDRPREQVGDWLFPSWAPESFALWVLAAAVAGFVGGTVVFG